MDNTCEWFFALANSHVAKEIMSVPKRELAAAVLLARLQKIVQETLKMSPKDTHNYMDSSIALQQIRKFGSEGPLGFKRFVADACKIITELCPVDQFHFIPSQYNSSDIITRFCTTEELFGARNIWFRPSIHFDETEIPTFTISKLLLPEIYEETPEIALISTTSEKNDENFALKGMFEMVENILTRVSTLRKAVNILIRVFQVIKKWKIRVKKCPAITMIKKYRLT